MIMRKLNVAIDCTGTKNECTEFASEVFNIFDMKERDVDVLKGNACCWSFDVPAFRIQPKLNKLGRMLYNLKVSGQISDYGFKVFEYAKEAYCCA